MSKSSNYAGRILIYSAPAALQEHITWAIEQGLGQVIKLPWQNQPLSPAAKALQLEYKHHIPIAAKLATALKAWHYIRFEIREVNKNTQDATYYRATPDLGLHQGQLASKFILLSYPLLLTVSNIGVASASRYGSSSRSQLIPSAFSRFACSFS